MIRSTRPTTPTRIPSCTWSAVNHQSTASMLCQTTTSHLRQAWPQHLAVSLYFICYLIEKSPPFFSKRFNVFCSVTGSTNGSAKKRGRNGEEIKDDAYWERRRKNNEAAKRSRDARRAKEDEIAIRAAFLEQENLKLRFELANLKNETAKLRCMIYNS